MNYVLANIPNPKKILLLIQQYPAKTVALVLKIIFLAIAQKSKQAKVSCRNNPVVLVAVTRAVS
jgi:hypothetical protein